MNRYSIIVSEHYCEEDYYKDFQYWDYLIRDIQNHINDFVYGRGYYSRDKVSKTTSTKETE